MNLFRSTLAVLAILGLVSSTQNADAASNCILLMPCETLQPVFNGTATQHERLQTDTRTGTRAAPNLHPSAPLRINHFAANAARRALPTPQKSSAPQTGKQAQNVIPTPLSLETAESIVPVERVMAVFQPASPGPRTDDSNRSAWLFGVLGAAGIVSLVIAKTGAT